MQLSRLPSISILIPAHDASRTIGSAIFSAWLTRPKRAEILVLLDGDNTNSPILELFEKRDLIKVFRTEEASGISGARNYLLAEARSDLVAWLDSDDVALPFRYGKSIRLIKTESADVVFSQSVIFGEKVRGIPFLPQFPFCIPVELSPLFLYLANPFTQSTMVARKSVLLEAGGYRDCPAEDYDLWMRLAAAGRKITRRMSYGVFYRIHRNQTTSDTMYEDRVLADSFVQHSHYELGAKITFANLFSGESERVEQIKNRLLNKSLGFWMQEKWFRPTLDWAKKNLLG